jgi:hypothetical protein
MFKSETFTSCGSTLVEHLPHHPKVKGSSPVNYAETGRDIIVKKSLEHNSSLIVLHIYKVLHIYNRFVVLR